MKKSKFILLLAFYISVSLLYGVFSNRQNEKEILNSIDARLYNHAISLKYYLPENYHDRTVNPQSISTDEDKYIAEKLTKIVQETEFKYNYTIIKKEGRLFFAASDLIADPGNERGTFYYYAYEDADESFYDAFDKQAPTYKTVTDQWGVVRTIMVPEKSPGGMTYLACADYDITYVRGLLKKNFLKSIITVIFLLLLTIPLIKAIKTSYRQAEEKQKTLKLQLANAMEIANLGHWEYEVEKDLFIFNDQFYKIFRTTAEQAGGYMMTSTEYTSRFVHPDDNGLVVREIQKSIETNELNFSRQLDHKILYADGNAGYVTVKYLIEKDSQGKTVKIYGVSQDITSRKTAEKERQESEAFFRNFTEQSFVGLYIIQDNSFKYVNPKFADIFGYTIDECLNGMKLGDLVHPEDLPTVLDKVRSRIQGETKVAQYTVRGIKKSGEINQISIYGSRLTYRGERAAMGTILDITSEKQQELERDQLIADLRKTVRQVKQLKGLLPICAHCKKIRDDEGYWSTLEAYVEKHSEASFSHGMCAECSDRLYGNEDWYIRMKEKKKRRPQ